MNNIFTLHAATSQPWELTDTVIFKDDQVIARFDNDDFDTPTNIANAAHVFKCVDENEDLHKRIAELAAALKDAHYYKASRNWPLWLEEQVNAALIKAGAQ